MDGPELHCSSYTIGDPPSLLPFAINLGAWDPSYLPAAHRQIQALSKAPRFPTINNKSVLSHRRDQAELWSDNIFMTAASLAAYGLATTSHEIMDWSISAIRGYWEELVIKLEDAEKGDFPESAGLWRHIVVASGEDQKNTDRGLWSTGNGWAGLGMCHAWASYLRYCLKRRATHPTDPSSPKMQRHISYTAQSLGDLIQGLMRRVAHNNSNTHTDPHDRGCALLPNYLNDPSYFKDCAGTAALAATIFRHALLALATQKLYPSAAMGMHRKASGLHFVVFGERLRNAVLAHADVRSGVAAPACWALDHASRVPCLSGTSEGLSFVVLMETAWRDWVRVAG